MADISDSASQSAQSSSQQQQQSSIPTSDGGRFLMTLRLLMQGKEVGSIIGKKGDNIKRFREVSGAKINVSDSSCLDRIVTLSGTLDEVYNAFSMICSKFEEQILQTSSSSGPTGASLSPSNATTTASDSTLGGDIKVTGANVTDPLFGLPSAGLLNSSLKDAGDEEADLLTINNNNTTTINNNNLDAPNKNGVGGATTTTPGSNKPSTHHPIVTTRLIVPASQCGSLIGRGGAKIKEIREVTGATIQVAPDVLPNSTERVVTINGGVESLKSCAYQIFKIIVESPAKGYVIQYRPKPVINPMLLAAATAGQAAAAYNLPGHFALSTQADVNRLLVANNQLAAAFNQTTLRAAAATGQAAAALSAAAVSAQQQHHEMAIPNGLIGCVIGKGGSKINEIRQLSGAIIKISNSGEGAKSRTVTISGSPEAISLAQYLINASCSGHQTFIANKTSRKFAPY